jgi:nitric-oxide synthase
MTERDLFPDNPILTERFRRAGQFTELFHRENGLPGAERRLEEIAQSLRETGTYTHTAEELAFGARVAWRNSNRCIGRLYWKSLKVFDLRHVETPEQVEKAVLDHLRTATNGGQIRSVITVFPPEGADGTAPLRFWNPQLIRYAGYRRPDGSVLGDPAHLELTEQCQALGWKGAGTAYDLLPVVFQWRGAPPQWFELPREDVMEIPIAHPENDSVAALGLRWHAVPIISDMALEIGGIYYPAAPFNGWYLVTEVASRNFGDTARYNQLPAVARCFGLDPNEKTGFWKDRAALELNRAVYHSFRAAGANMVDHHTSSEQFLQFEQLEIKHQRAVNADWSWIVPPLGGSSLGVFHRTYPNEVCHPNFFYQTPVWKPAEESPPPRCPFSRGD